MINQGLKLMMMGAKSGGIIGQQAYTSPGIYTWVCPAGVTSVCVVMVGGSGQGPTYQYGGGLNYKNNIAVTPGNSYTVKVGGIAGGMTQANNQSYFIDASFMVGAGPDRSGGNGGGNGGRDGSGGGGAGGYSGDGGSEYSGSMAGAGGGGGAGSYFHDTDLGIQYPKGGGGVGILGQGPSGGSSAIQYGPTDSDDGSSIGHGGSGGGDGIYNQGGLYGGGPAGGYNGCASGAVRIIWGAGRAFPSTNTGNL